MLRCLLYILTKTLLFILNRWSVIHHIFIFTFRARVDLLHIIHITFKILELTLMMGFLMNLLGKIVRLDLSLLTLVEYIWGPFFHLSLLNQAFKVEILSHLLVLFCLTYLTRSLIILKSRKFIYPNLPLLSYCLTRDNSPRVNRISWVKYPISGFSVDYPQS